MRQTPPCGDWIHRNASCFRSHELRHSDWIWLLQPHATTSTPNCRKAKHVVRCYLDFLWSYDVYWLSDLVVDNFLGLFRARKKLQRGMGLPNIPQLHLFTVLRPNANANYNFCASCGDLLFPMHPQRDTERQTAPSVRISAIGKCLGRPHKVHL